MVGKFRRLSGLIEIQMKIRFLGELGRIPVVLGRYCVVCMVVSL